MRPAVFALCLLVATGCADVARLPQSETTGPDPTLPAPARSLIPTISVPKATGWPPGAMPSPDATLTVAAFAADLQHPRWLYVLPNGDVLVAETAAPPRPEDVQGIRGRLMKHFMKQAGASVPSADRITLLRDADGDGWPEVRTAFLENLTSPFGMALAGSDFYVANTDALLRFPYQSGQTQIRAPGVKVADLPGGPRNHHWTKNVIASRDGARLYVTVGSNSNVAEHGMQVEAGRAAIWEVDPKTGTHRIFASGLRNPNGLGWEPQTGALWTVVNERDELGSDLVPDYLTSVRDGGFYGWPYSYYGQHVDTRVEPPRSDLVAQAIKPDYALGNHVAALGLAFSAKATALPEQWRSGAFVGEHGSWNRKPLNGYKVVYVPFRDGKPWGLPVDVLTGFVSADGNAYGRPVGVAVDGRGALLVADDVGNVVWRVTAAPR